MSLLGQGGISSPLQSHQVLAANDIQWVEGNLETRGAPHTYINQEDQNLLTISDALVAPWTFTGLPDIRPAKVVLVKQTVQLLVFTGEAAIESLRESPRTDTLILNLPLTIVRGRVPFLSEARLENFLEFWKGQFLPVTSARIHYLASATATPPPQADLVYLNRSLIQSYVQG